MSEEELEELEMEDSLEKREKIDANKLIFDEDNEKVKDINETLEWVEKQSKSYMDSHTLLMKQHDELYAKKISIINNNQAIREQMIQETGVDSTPYINQGSPYINLPESLFGMNDEEIDYNDDTDGIPKHSYLQGNLANMYNDL